MVEKQSRDAFVRFELRDDIMAWDFRRFDEFLVKGAYQFLVMKSRLSNNLYEEPSSLDCRDRL